MRKRANLPRKNRQRLGHGMEEVNGSTPLCSTTSQLKQTDQIIEIPEDYRVIPAIEWDCGQPRLFRVLIKGNPK